jgi:hypothetical protein
MSKKKSSVRHTRAIQHQRSKRPTVGPSADVIEDRLAELVHPALFSQMALFHQMGQRERTLGLPVMLALVLSLIWRQFGSVAEAVRVLKREGFLWTSPVQVSQQAVSERMRTLPAVLFENIYHEVLPSIDQRYHARKRPVEPVITRALGQFTAVVALDGSTLDVLMRKTGLLRDQAKAPLAGRMAAVLDVASRLPRQLWYEPDSQAHDQRFWEGALATLAPGTLLLFDMGFINYGMFARLGQQKISFITRLKKNAVYQVEQVLTRSDQVRDQLIRLGRGASACSLRLVEVFYQGHWYQYVTNVLDPKVLSGADVAALYQRRWRIENAFNAVKRLLGLAYFFSGSQNAVQVQVWMTWLLYAVLVDLADEVAEMLSQPFQRISLEMVFRGLYHFTQAYHRGQASDPVVYLAEQAKELGIVKQKRPRKTEKGLTKAHSP